MSDKKIRLNRIDFDSIAVNWSELFSRYSFFRINASADIPYDSYLMDPQYMDKKILSAFRLYGKCMYVLGLSSLTKNEIQKAIDVLENKISENIIITEVGESELSRFPRILLQLLFNALGNYEFEGSCQLNNMTGHLYCWEESNLRKNRLQFPCVEIKIDKNLDLHLDAVMFSDIKLKEHFSKCKKKPESLPRYVVGPKRSLIRTYDKNEKTYYVQRAIDGKRQTVNFLGMRKYLTFKKSKMGFLYECMLKFKKKYDGIVSFDFKEVISQEEIRQKYSLKEKFKEQIKFILKDIGIQVKDHVGDVKSTALKEKIEEQFKEIGIPLKNSSPYVISIVHSKNFYEGGHDPYSDDVEGYVQHITLETFNDKNFDVPIALCFIKEMLIKQDLERGYITMTDWAQFNFKSDVRFVTARTRKVKEDPIILDEMLIHPDGRFEFSELKAGKLFAISMGEYDKVKDKLDLDEEGVMEYGDDINVIRKTDLFPLPEFEIIGDEMKVHPDKRFSRSNEIKDTVLYSVLDLKMFKVGNAVHYISGPRGDHLDDTISNASVVRRIDVVDGSKALDDKFLQLLDNFFVKNLSQTVIPFPFKYLREYQNRI